MAKKKPADIHDEIVHLKLALAEAENKWKRALADYQNLEKRVATQREVYVRLANVTLIEKLLPVLDDLERASQHIQDDGLRMVEKQFGQVLESEEVKRMDIEGKEFDPKLMDCVEKVAGKKNVIVEMVLAGYQMGDTVIRPAKVKVGDGTHK